jgi:hypothetical protein
MYAYVCVHIYMCIYIHVYVLSGGREQVQKLDMYVCQHICTYACVCFNIYMYTCVCVSLCFQAVANKYKRMAREARKMSNKTQ